MEPDGFETGAWIGLAGEPAGDIGQDAGTALAEECAGLFLHPTVGRKGEVEEFGVLAGIEIDSGCLGSALGGDAPDPAVFVIASGIAEIDFAMLDDGVGPVGDVEGAIGSEAEVDGAEGDVGGTEDIGHLDGLEAGTGFLEAEADDALGAEIAGDEIALPIGGEGGAVDPFEAGELGVVAGAHAFRFAAHVGVGEVRGAIDGVIEPLESGAIGEEGIAELIPVMTPGIATALGEDLHEQGVGVEAPDPTRVQPHHPVRGFDVGVGIDRLVHIDVAIEAPSQGVEIVMGILGAEAGEDDAADVGLAITVGVGEVEQLMAGGDIDPAAVVGQDTGGNEDAFSKHGGLVGLAIAIGVFHHDHGVLGFLAGSDLGIDAGAGDPEASLVIPVHLDRFVELGIFGPERDFEPFSNGEGGDGLFLEMGIGDGLAGGRAGQAFDFGDDGGGRCAGAAELGDAGFPFGDEGFELRDLDGVLALFVFSEAEEVGPVGGAPAMEEEFVLLADAGEQGG